VDSVNVWAVLAAGASAFVLGGLWYSPLLFAKSWQRAAAFTNEDLQRSNNVLVLSGALLLSLLAAFVFARFLGPAPASRRAFARWPRVSASTTCLSAGACGSSW
jgi:hypothetical protein